MITCPTCQQAMTPLNSHGKPRKFCSGACASRATGAALTKRDTYVDEVEHLTSFGMSPTRILDALGVGAEALARGLSRAGRRDLARPYWRLRREERSRPCVDCGQTCSYRAQRCRRCGMLASYAAARTAA